ncbi:hypothetical protein CYMTET_30847 [Cymbomonas tetramitiformis]|uniref:OTU domain-containing protein n=1 Tax=Cymbomonas tetramitiformis TaxID=36881 RepID=A0AAE0FJH8_9CHLO|nr:hypothetical protein CYMTET_30847 [Cymbomonas tetramitiformis]
MSRDAEVGSTSRDLSEDISDNVPTVFTEAAVLSEGKAEAQTPQPNPNDTKNDAAIARALSAAEAQAHRPKPITSETKSDAAIAQALSAAEAEVQRPKPIPKDNKDDAAIAQALCAAEAEAQGPRPVTSETRNDAAIAEALSAAEAEVQKPRPIPSENKDDAAIAQALSDEGCKFDESNSRDEAILESLSKYCLPRFSLKSISPYPRRCLSAIAPSPPTLDPGRSRLSERLKFYGLEELEIRGDGNCQFRALSDQLYRNPEYHASVRQRVCQQLASEMARYSSYVVDTEYSAYVQKMGQDGEWGDAITLQVLPLLECQRRAFRLVTLRPS